MIADMNNFERMVLKDIAKWLVEVRDYDYYLNVSRAYEIAEQHAFNRSIMREYWDEKFKNYGKIKHITYDRHGKPSSEVYIESENTRPFDLIY